MSTQFVWYCIGVGSGGFLVWSIMYRRLQFAKAQAFREGRDEGIADRVAFDCLLARRGVGRRAGL